MVRISFIGDISFSDQYIELYTNDIDPFKSVRDELENSDIVIGNLECIAEGKEGENTLRMPRLKTKLETLNYLKKINISLVTLAHNHIYDNLKDGYMRTKQFLNASGIESIGAGLSASEAAKPFLFENKGLKFCFISYVTKDTNPGLPKDCPIFLNYYNEEKIISTIKTYKNKDYKIVLLFHWGGRLEGGRYPDLYQIQDAKKFIQKGADLIIGHHSHTLQPFQKINEKYVFYSLGNFCFSNINFEGKEKRILNQNKFTNSAIVHAYFEKDRYSIKMVPIRNRNLFIIRRNKIYLIYLRCKSLILKLLIKYKKLWKLYFFKHHKLDPYIQMLYNVKEISYIKKLKLKFKKSK